MYVPVNTQTTGEQLVHMTSYVESGCVLWKMLSVPTVRRALTVGCLLQLFQQMAGINTVMCVCLSSHPIAVSAGATSPVILAPSPSTWLPYNVSPQGIIITT